jgi:uncharacterized protein YcfL
MKKLHYFFIVVSIFLMAACASNKANVKADATKTDFLNRYSVSLDAMNSSIRPVSVKAYNLQRIEEYTPAK